MLWLLCEIHHSHTSTVRQNLPLGTNYWLSCRTLSQTMFHQSRLSNEHVTIRFRFESASMSAGATSYGHQNWTLGNKSRVGGTRRQCHDFETSSEDIQLIGDLLLTYEMAKGALLNIRKFKTMAASSWDKSINMLDIPYYQEVTILGFRFRSTVDPSANATLSRATRKVKALARDTYRRDLYLKQRIHYVHTTLLSKVWHTAQIFPNPKRHQRQIVKAISWYTWRGAIFSVTLSTLQRRTKNGDMGFIDKAAKSRALFRIKYQTRGYSSGSLTVEWLNVWASLPPRTILPHIRVIPRTLK